MKKFYDKYSWLIIILLILALVFLKNCSHETEPKNPINLKPELKAQDSLKNVVDSLDKTSKILQDKAYKLDSTAKFYVNKYRYYKAKFLSQKDTTPHGKEILFITQSCDSLIAQDSIRDLAWKELHKNDSTENSALKNLTRIQDIISIKKDTIIQQKTDSIHDLTKKLKRQKRFTKGAFITGLLGGGYLGFKIKN